jgi:hypothetical protein
MINFNNVLIVLFTILFCYIIFYWIYKSCFGYKIIEGIDEKDSDPKVVTKESVEEEDKKKSEEPSSDDAEEQANSANDKMLTANQNRKDANQPTPPSDKLLQASFS